MADVEVYPINITELTNDRSFFRQLTNHGESYTVKNLAYLSDHPAGVAVFDTGLSAEMVESPEEYGAYGTPEMVERARRLDFSESDTMVARIGELGYEPSDVDGRVARRDDDGYETVGTVPTNVSGLSSV